MAVMPLHLVRVAGETAFVFLIAFAVVCALTLYLRARPAPSPHESALADHLHALLDAASPFVLLLAAPVQANTSELDAAATVKRLEQFLRALVRKDDAVLRHEGQTMALVVKTDRVVAFRIAARASARAENVMPLCLAMAVPPSDGGDAAALIAAAGARLDAALERGRPGGSMAVPTEVRVAEEPLSTPDADGLARELGRFLAGRRRSAVAIFNVGIDHFGKHEEQYGRQAMNDLMRDTGATLRRHVRRGDWGAQVAGGSFFLAMPGTPDQARDVAARLLACVRRPVVAAKGASVRMTASIGVAFAPGSAASAPELLEASAIAMNIAKGKGGNTVVNFERTMWTVRSSEVQRDVF